MSIEINPEAKALIFDIDGTLADTMTIHYNAWKEVGAMMDFNYPREVFDELAGIPTYKIIPLLNERLNLNLNVDETLKIKEKIFLDKLHEVKKIEPVTDLVYKYSGKMPMSLGTGGRKHIAEKTIEYIGLSDYFDIMVSADDVENHKPFPDTFLKCAEQMGVEPQFCQVFEDGIQGIRAAESAGMIVTDIRPFV